MRKSLLLLPLLFVAGCGNLSTSYSQFSSGQDLHNSVHVAVNPYMDIRHVDGVSINPAGGILKENLYLNPGSHVIGVRYSKTGEYGEWIHTTDETFLEFEANAGDRLLLYNVAESQNKFQPAIVELR